MERTPKPKTRRSGLIAASVGAASLFLGLTSCTSTTSPEAALKTISLPTSMEGYVDPKNPALCLNGGPRPCAMLVRTAPNLASDPINANPKQVIVKWPQEAYGNHSVADSLNVICYTVTGAEEPSEDDPSSPDWYEVEVPKSEVKNPYIHVNHSSHYSQTSAASYGNIVLGWASIEWFNQNVPSANVPNC